MEDVKRNDSRLIESDAQRGFVVWSRAGLGSIVGEPDPDALVRAVEEVPQLLAFPENIALVKQMLPECRAEPAVLFRAPEVLPAPPAHPCFELDPIRIVSSERSQEEPSAVASTARSEEVMRSEPRCREPVVAAFDGARPVAVAYVAWETERHWDVSIDAFESHRRRGYATAAVSHLMHLMRRKGKVAVWGAAHSNPASMNLARRLGFVKADTIWVVDTGRAERLSASSQATSAATCSR